MKKLIILLILSISVICNSQIANSECDNARDLTYLSDNEKDMIKEINIVRTNPKSYIPYVKDYLHNSEQLLGGFKNGSFTSKNPNTELYLLDDINAAKELIYLLETIEPVGILIPNKDMYKFSKKHVNYMIKNNKLEHSNLKMKMIYAENISYNDDGSMIKSLVAFLVDGNVKSRGHRKTLLNINYTYISIAVKDNFIVQNFGGNLVKKKKRK